MDNVRLPIRTSREGNKITKVCVEDIYKMINRIGAAEERSAEKWNEIWESLDKDVEDADGGIVNGCLVVGTGISQPNIKDAFDETVGNNIAFMKAKLNANFKKRNILYKFYKAANITLDAIAEEVAKIDNKIYMDLEGIRKHNPEYLNRLDEYGYEFNLDDDYEVQEEEA